GIGDGRKPLRNRRDIFCPITGRRGSGSGSGNRPNGSGGRCAGRDGCEGQKTTGILSFQREAAVKRVIESNVRGKTCKFRHKIFVSSKLPAAKGARRAGQEPTEDLSFQRAEPFNQRND